MMRDGMASGAQVRSWSEMGAQKGNRASSQEEDRTALLIAWVFSVN